MLGQIIKIEWKNLLAERTVWFIGLMFAACIGYAGFNGYAWTSFQKNAIAATVNEVAEKDALLKKQIAEFEINAPAQISRFSDPRDPVAAGRNLGLQYAAMPPAPLALLSTGQSDLLPYYFKISTRSLSGLFTGDEIENPDNLLSGRFDIAFLIIYLLPLIILALTYNFLSSEREDGVLAMIMSQPVKLGLLITGKLLLRFLIALLFIVGITFLLLALGGELAADGSITRLLLWIVAVSTYSAFWFVLAMAVNKFGWNSAANAVALAGAWLFLVILLPTILNVAISVTYPVPSRVEMINAGRDASSDATKQGSQLLSKYMEDHPELAAGDYDPNDAAARMYVVQEKVEEQMRPVLARYDAQLDKQQRSAAILKYLSPAIIMQDALNDISGTGADRYEHFMAQVQNFHAEWQNYYIPRVYRKERIVAATYDNAPRFEWTEEQTMPMAGRVMTGLAGIAAMTILLAIFGSRNKKVAVS